MSESQDSENSVQNIQSEPNASAVPEGQPVAQPEYGQRKMPDYGAMRSQFPKDYDPYVFGRSDDQQPKDKGDSKPQRSFSNPFSGFGQQTGDGGRNGANQSGQPQSGQPQNGGPSGAPVNGQNWGTNGNAPYGGAGPYGPNGGFQGQNQGQGPAFGGYDQYGQNGQMPQSPQDANHVPDMRGGFDMNDPNQNPLWGHWSAMAIFSFICSLFGMPFLGAILGAFSIWRTKLYHMRGRGLAIAAVIIGIIFILLELWIISNPSMMSQLQQMMDNAGIPDFGASSI